LHIPAEFPESTGILDIPALILGGKDAGRNRENGTKEELLYFLLIPLVQNDPTIQLWHSCLYHIQAFLQLRLFKSTCQQGWHCTGPTTAAYHLTRSKRPPHCDNYTKVLSCILWNPLMPQLQFLLTTCCQSYWHSSRHTYDHDIALQPSPDPTATIYLLHDHFRPPGLKSYSTVVPFLTIASLLAYLPALTTKFRGWIRLYLLLKSALLSPTKTRHF